jgi:hypothetical protein
VTWVLEVQLMLRWTRIFILRVTSSIKAPLRITFLTKRLHSKLKTTL